MDSLSPLYYFSADSQASHSYASAVKQSAINNNTKETNSVSTQTTSVSTQTELTWPLSSKLPTMIPRTNENGARAKTTVSSQTTPTTSDHNLNPENIKTTKPSQHHTNKTGSITKLSQRDKDKPDSTKLPPNKPAIQKKTKKLKQLYTDRIKKGVLGLFCAHCLG